MCMAFPLNAPTIHQKVQNTLLFHLPTDPDEDTDLAETQPDQLERMQGLLAAELKEIDAPAELVAKLGF